VDAFTLLSIPFIAILVGVISRASFLLNSEVVNGGWLTAIGITMGCLVALLIAFVRRHARHADRLTIRYPHRERWFTRLVNWPLVVTMAIFGSMVAVTLANRAGSSGPSIKAEYTITGFGSQRAGTGRQRYVGLTNGSHKLKFKCYEAECAQLQAGQSVAVTMNRGLLGFSYVDSIQSIANRAVSW
jgi:hypothetical protein